MDFLTLAKTRCSVRKYQEKEIEAAKVEHILEAARIAPTAVNYQPHHVLVLQGKEALTKLKDAANCFNAPLLCVVCVDTSKSWVRPFDNKSMADVDGAIVATHIMLAAERLGLATCWVAHFKPDLVKKDFNFPASMEPVAIICIGYPADEKLSPERHTSQRRPLAEMVHHNAF